ncbi:MAG: Fic family protein [Candidatus Woesearchaeota archaeon]
MSYIEKRKKGNNEYYYFTKRFLVLRERKAIKYSTGKNIPKEKYIIDNLDKISNEELNAKAKSLNKLKSAVPYNEKRVQRVELKAIQIQNLLEAKNCAKLIYTEFAKEFIFNSNNIEGSKIPPESVREIIDNGNTRYKNKNEVREVENSIRAFEYLQTGFKFNIPSIKRLYYILTKDLTMENNLPYPKGFKKVHNIVGNTKTTAPEHVEKDLHNLINWLKEYKHTNHPLVFAFEFHARYERIHPFLDGNGRTGRLLINKIIMSNNYFPIIIYKSNKKSYFNALAKLENKSKYYQFMLTQTEKTYDYILELLDKY